MLSGTLLLCEFHLFSLFSFLLPSRAVAIWASDLTWMMMMSGVEAKFSFLLVSSCSGYFHLLMEFSIQKLNQNKKRIFLGWLRIHRSQTVRFSSFISFMRKQFPRCLRWFLYEAMVNTMVLTIEYSKDFNSFCF